MITVVIPLYNKEHQIQKTLDSVFAQTFKDFEVIIVNDGSTDSSVQVVKNYLTSKEIPLEESFPDVPDLPDVPDVPDSQTPHSSFPIPHFRLIHQPNSGVSAARNTGIENAKYDLIAFLDADDEWHPDYLQKQIGLIKKYSEASVFATNYQFKNEKGELSPTIINKLPFEGEDGILSNYFYVASCSHPPLWSSAIVAKKSAVQEIGGFPIGIKSGEDLLTWAKLACQFNIAYSKVPKAVFCQEGYKSTEKPKRLPAENDFVGNELLILKEKFNPPYINQYLSLWHKMRSSIYMRLGMSKESMKEALIGLKFNPLNYKLYAFILLNLLPSPLSPFKKNRPLQKTS